MLWMALLTVWNLFGVVLSNLLVKQNPTFWKCKDNILFSAETCQSNLIEHILLFPDKQCSELTDQNKRTILTWIHMIHKDYSINLHGIMLFYVGQRSKGCCWQSTTSSLLHTVLCVLVIAKTIVSNILSRISSWCNGRYHADGKLLSPCWAPISLTSLTVCLLVLYVLVVIVGWLLWNFNPHLVDLWGGTSA